MSIWRHKERGTLYSIVDYARLKGPQVIEGDRVDVYRDQDGSAWVAWLGRHDIHGRIINIVGSAFVQAATPIPEGAVVMVYRGEDGRLWVRLFDEFHDGRFERVRCDY